MGFFFEVFLALCEFEVFGNDGDGISLVSDAGDVFLVDSTPENGGAEDVTLFFEVFIGVSFSVEQVEVWLVYCLCFRICLSDDEGAGEIVSLVIDGGGVSVDGVIADAG